MKPLIGVFLAVVSVSVSRGQLLCDFQGKDSVVAIVTGDTIVVWDIAACAYCSAEFSFSITSSADSIYITQTDTAGRLATCECIFDLRTSLSGLSGGRYWIVLYRDLLSNTATRRTPTSSSNPCRWTTNRTDRRGCYGAPIKVNVIPVLCH